MKIFSISVSLLLGLACYVQANNAQKRAPSGFMGMRGKKSIPDSAFSEPTQTVDDAGSPQETNPGEEIAGETLNGQILRNQGDETMGQSSSMAQSGLMGQSVGQSNSIGQMDKRTPSGFMGMRGKKPSDEWAQQREYSMGYFKRAPQGFFGMRGKKENYYGDEFEKRGPSGFVGMRGKKEYDLVSDGFNGYGEKRAPSGFMGMRGKKEYDEIFEEIKRAQNAGFFGMRGKKQPGRSGFFGMRGKKYPYEFRGKFVGVRGKKMSNDVSSVLPTDYNSQYLDEQLQSLGAADLDLNQLMLLLTENSDVWDVQSPRQNQAYLDNLQQQITNN